MNLGRSHRIGLLSRRDELLNLALPALIFIVLFVFWLVIGKFSKPSQQVIHFVAGSVFLNVGHTVLSFFILTLMPEGRAWFMGLPGSRRRNKLIKWSAILLVLLWFFWVGERWLNGHFFRFQITLIIAFVLAFIANYQHTLWQIRGISSAYNRLIENLSNPSAENKARIRRFEKRERLLFYGLLACTAIGLAERLSRRVNFVSLTFVICLLLFTAIMVNSLLFPESGRTTKSFYLIRLIFFPLAIFSPIFALGVPFFHGVEYTFLFRHMWRKSRIPNSRRATYTWQIILPLVAFASFLTIARTNGGLAPYVGDAISGSKPWMFKIAGVSLAFNYFHFYFDREIFRMRDQEVREHIGPLIV
jgi:hypothetical protein